MKKHRLAVIMIVVALCAAVGVGFTACVPGKPQPSTSYKVTFMAGGTELPSQTVKSGEKALEPKAPAPADGQQFDYWTLDGAEYNFDTPVTSDITLIAQFSEISEQFTVKFMFNGADSEEVYAQVKVNKGALVTAPAQNPTREGYFFGGWIRQGVVFDFSQPINADLTVRAKWYTDDTQIWTVTYDLGASKTYDYVVDRETPNVPMDPVREGYIFVDWYSEGSQFDFDAEIRKNILVTAVWNTEALKGIGTKELPYLLNEYADFHYLGSKLNIARGKNESDGAWELKVAEYSMYASAHYTMTKDVVMPAPIAPIAFNADYPFSGAFDGKGHTLSDLKITQTVADSKFDSVGLFGNISDARIENLKLVKVNLFIKSDNGYRSALNIGGLAGVATSSSIKYVSVNGKIENGLYDPTAAAIASGYVGGIVGSAQGESKDGVAVLGLIAYCSSDAEIIGAVESRAGGIVGQINGGSGPTSVVGCYSTAKVTGGVYAGGIAGGMIYRNSVINCYASGIVQGIEIDSNVGGICGYIGYGDVIMDCYSDVVLSAPIKRGGSTAGPIVAYVFADDFEYSRINGGSVVNSHFNRDRLPKKGVHADEVNIVGKAVLASAVKEAWFKTTLRWTDEDWNFEKRLPTLNPDDNKVKDRTFRVKLEFPADSGAKSIETTVDAGSVLGKMDSGVNYTVDTTPYVFFDWVYDLSDNRPYSYAMPVYKDITLYEKAYDVSNVVGYWFQTGDGNDFKSNFTLYFGPDGTVKWFGSSLSAGSYIFDGVNLCFSVANGLGETCALFTNADLTKLTFKFDAGISGDAIYNAQSAASLGAETALVNAYSAPDGNMLYVINGDSLYYENETDTYRATYTASSAPGVYDVVFDKKTEMGITAATFTATGNAGAKELVADFRSNNAQFNDSGAYTPLLVTNYEGESFLGDYWSFYGDGYGGRSFNITFNADGSAVVTDHYKDGTSYPHDASYIYLQEASMIKLFYDTHTSNFTLAENSELIYGAYNRGSMSKPGIFLMRSKPVAYQISVGGKISNRDVLFLDMARNKVYFVLNNNVELNATSGCEAIDFVDGGRVTLTVGGVSQDYRIVGKVLHKIGPEEGLYTQNGTSATVEIDGIGNARANGKKVGIYFLYGTELVVLYDNGSFLSFDYAAAQKNAYKFTPVTPDDMQGVWYNCDATGKPLVEKEKSYKVAIDGFGHLYYYYYADKNTLTKDDDEYVLNFSEPKPLMRKTLISATATLNASGTIGEMILLQNKNILVFNSANSDPMVMVKLSYTGMIPKVDAFDKAMQKVWTKVGDATQRMIITATGKSTWNGSTIGVAYDGINKVMHIRGANGADFTATVKDGKLTLRDAQGATTEWVVETGSLPPDAYNLIGIWQGPIQTPNFDEIKLEINDNLSGVMTGKSSTGTTTPITLPVGTFNDEKDTVTWIVNSTTYSATYNSKTGNIIFKIQQNNDDAQWYEATLTIV